MHKIGVTIHVPFKNEQKILELLWTQDRPMTSKEIIAKMSITESSTHRLLRSLLKNGLLFIAGVQIQEFKGSPSRLFSPSYSREGLAHKRMSAYLETHNIDPLQFALGFVPKDELNENLFNLLNKAIEENKGNND